MLTVVSRGRRRDTAGERGPLALAPVAGWAVVQVCKDTWCALPRAHAQRMKSLGDLAGLVTTSIPDPQPHSQAPKPLCVPACQPRLASAQSFWFLCPPGADTARSRISGCQGFVAEGERLAGRYTEGVIPHKYSRGNF